MPPALLILLGAVGLLIGCEIAVGAAQRIARRLGVSHLVVGLTITSVGTSLPEIATNVASAISVAGGVDASGIAVGNVIGSNLSQITLLLGVTALLSPITVPPGSLRRDGATMAAAMFVMLVTCLDGEVTRWEGAVLIGAYVAYLTWVVSTARRGGLPADSEPLGGRLWGDLAKALGGLVVLVISAEVMVNSGVALAERFGLSQSLIGLGVGLGTGLPELAVALRAAMKGAGELGLGNLIGSNITDPLLSFGAGAAVYPLHVPEVALTFDFPWWIMATVVALTLMREDNAISRREGAVLVMLFLLFAYQRVFFFRV
jgi:cation:H+ antiporter